MAPCPHGHRALEVKDVAVGMQVVYVSRDANTLINTHITKAGVFEGSSGPCVATQHKHAALLNRLFVPQRQSSAPDEGAAVGATQTAAAAPAGESAVSPSAVAPAAAAAAAAGMEVQDEQAEIEDADTFLQHSVVPWLKAMQEEASDRNISLPAVLKMRMLASVTSNGQPLASSLAELVLRRFRALVHWKGYVNFQQVPKSSKKGTLHICMLSYEESAYAAHGMFVSDAQVLLSGGGFAGLDQKTLHIKPRPGAKLSEFGWEADGAVVNSTYAFALTCITAFAMEHNISLPQPLARLLESIPVQYTKHKDSQQRLLQNLVDSAVQRHANRTVQCPIFLAEEFGRCTFQPQFVKPFVKLYQQRMAVTPQLLMPQRMEDCVIRLMTPAKTGKDSLKILSGSVVRFTWNDGPWKVGHLMSSYFPVGASLNDSMVDAWRRHGAHTECADLHRTAFGVASRVRSI